MSERRRPNEAEALARPGRRSPPRLLYTGAAIVVAVAFVGFLTGTRHPPPPEGYAYSGGEEAREGAPVPDYTGMREDRRGPNEDLYAGAFGELRERLPERTEPVERSGSLLELRRQRVARRAYDGAPPTVPHSIDQRDYPSCLTCHDTGAVIAGLVAPAMSHEPYQSCTQCHVPQSDPLGLDDSPPPANGFVGRLSPAEGTRAWPGAPPTIPHATWMRSRCDSCHGVSGASPIRSTHPWRQSCQQCHVADAANERRNAFPLLGDPNEE